MHHKIEEKLVEVGEMKYQLIDALKGEMAKGIDCLDTKEAGEVVDMIKDLAETEEKCMKAKYYESIIEAMEDAEEYMDEEMSDRRGFRGRSARTGRFVSRRGYPKRRIPPEMDVEESYMSDYLDDPMRFRDGMMPPMGYTRTNMPHSNVTHHMNRPSSYGRSYEGYRNAKRGYTETNSPEYKTEMEEHAKHHVEEAIETFREMWNDADPNLRKEMKTHFQKLVTDMGA